MTIESPNSRSQYKRYDPSEAVPTEFSVRKAFLKERRLLTLTELTYETGQNLMYSVLAQKILQRDAGRGEYDDHMLVISSEKISHTYYDPYLQHIFLHAFVRYLAKNTDIQSKKRVGKIIELINTRYADLGGYDEALDPLA